MKMEIYGLVRRKIKKKLIDLSKKSNIIRGILRKVRYFKNRMRYMIYHFSPIDDKAIIFESFMGRNYSDNPRAIYEYLLKNKKYREFRFIWAFKDIDRYRTYSILNNENTIMVKYGSREYYRAYGKSKYWISNSRIPEAIYKKAGQIYVQCWHGTPLKKLGYDIDVEGKNALNSNQDIRNKYKADAKRYSFMISSSKFCTEKFVSAFNLKALGKENVILEEGFPRNDILSNYDKRDADEIRGRLGIAKDKKIILYAPTWRDNQHDSEKGYVYKNELDFSKLKKSLSDSYIVLFRTHYFVANRFDFKKYEGFVIDVSEYEDIGELYVISDMLVTDYSSVFFDYAVLRKPIMFFMYDLEEYGEEIRGVYLPLGELPGEICKTEEMLIEEIKNTEKTKVPVKYDAFRKKYNYLDDGHATERVVSSVIGIH